mmetsp:Transcript_3120/g.7029  ORF Transcript_3120/g.7029 Transcript_3120/m.7029 type:complete len:100 (-) Transcript_3120:236-535(-)
MRVGLAWVGLLAAAMCGSALQVQQPDEAQLARENWLAAHLKENFEMKDGRLAPQSGLSIPWNHDQIKPRNAKDDCGGVAAEQARRLAQAEESGRLKATR